MVRDIDGEFIGLIPTCGNHGAMDVGDFPG